MTTADSVSPAPVRPNPDARIWLFDFDNTIAHLEPEVDWAACRRQLEAFLRETGVADEIFTEIPKGNLPLYESLRARLSESETSQFVARTAATKEAWGVNGEILLRNASAIIERYELAGIDRAEPTRGALELLNSLASRGKTIAIVTSNSSRTVSHWLERYQVSRFISAIVGRDSRLALKPSPAMVFEALCRFDVGQQTAVFVGDSTADLRAAQAAGIGFYGIATSSARRDRLAAAGAAEIFASPAALQTCLALSGGGSVRS